MRSERNDEILLVGMGVAKRRMEEHPSRADYPHDFSRLYGWLEDKVYNLYEAIELKQYEHARQMAGEIIVTASEIAEYAGIYVDGPVRPRGKEDEVAHN